MWVSYRPDQAWVALLLNIASSISCHKLAGVALARCLSRQVKNDPPTADRTAQLAGWAMGVLGRPIPRAPGAGGRYIGLEWAVASRSRPREGGCLGPQRDDPVRVWGGHASGPDVTYHYAANRRGVSGTRGASASRISGGIARCFMGCRPRPRRSSPRCFPTPCAQAAMSSDSRCLGGRRTRRSESV